MHIDTLLNRLFQSTFAFIALKSQNFFSRRNSVAKVSSTSVSMIGPTRGPKNLPHHRRHNSLLKSKLSMSPSLFNESCYVTVTFNCYN